VRDGQWDGASSVRDIVIVGYAYSGLAGIVEAEEEQLSVLVCQPELGEHVPNYTMACPSASFLLPVCCFAILSALDMRQPARCRCGGGGDQTNVHQSTIHIMSYSFSRNSRFGWVSLRRVGVRWLSERVMRRR
jgi:hypothetical protein